MGNSYSSVGIAKSYKDMRTWQAARTLNKSIYSITDKFPKSELFGLTSQLRRASVSVCSNLAEGYGRKGKQEKIQFYHIALGSVLEVECQLILAADVNIFDATEEYIENLISLTKNSLLALIKSINLNL